MFEGLNKVIAVRKEYHERMKKEGSSAMKEALAEFFEAHPEVENVVWKQYTPYFNDGDPCTFSITEAGIYFNEKATPEYLKKTLRGRHLNNIEYNYDCRTGSNQVDHGPYSDDKLIELYVGYEPEGFEDYTSCTDYDLNTETDLYNNLNELSKGLSAIDTVLQDTLGDHILVVCSRESIETEEYEHD